MAQLWTTGEARIYVQPFDGPGYLGTARIKPYVELVPEYSPFYSDETGRKVPNDVSFDMEHAYISAEVNRFDEVFYEAMIRSQRSNASDVVGSYGFKDMGTLLLSEIHPIELWIVFPYSTVRAYSGMPAGYHFPSTIFTGPDKFTDLGVSDRAILMTWHALPDLNDSGTGFILYDFDVGGLPAPD